MTDTDIAWAAGFFEGEGCIRVNYKKKTGYKVLHLSIAQVDKRPLDKFREIFGGVGSVVGPYKYATNKQFHYIYTAYASNAKNMIHFMRPYLFRKGEQADAAIKEIEEYENRT